MQLSTAAYSWPLSALVHLVFRAIVNVGPAVSSTNFLDKHTIAAKSVAVGFVKV